MVALDWRAVLCTVNCRISNNVRATNASSSSFTSLVDIHQKEPSQSLAEATGKLGISYAAKFKNYSFNIQVMNGLKHVTIAKCFRSDKARIARFLNVF